MYDSIYHSLVFILDKVYDNYIVKLKRSHGKFARRSINLLFIIIKKNKYGDIPTFSLLQLQEPVLLLGKERFAGVDIRVRVKGGGHVAQIYGGC